MQMAFIECHVVQQVRAAAAFAAHSDPRQRIFRKLTNSSAASSPHSPHSLTCPRTQPNIRTNVRSWRDHFAQSYPGKTGVATGCMWSAQRGSSGTGVSYVKDFYSKIWLKARKRL